MKAVDLQCRKLRQVKDLTCSKTVTKKNMNVLHPKNCVRESFTFMRNIHKSLILLFR
jgi:hypothetical protein